MIIYAGTATLNCSVDDLTSLAGGGTIIVNNEGCDPKTPTKTATWGVIKAMYR